MLNLLTPLARTRARTHTDKPVPRPLPASGLDRLLALAAHALDAPVAVASLVEADRVVLRSYQAPSGAWEPLPPDSPYRALCNAVVARGEPLIVEDLRRHPLALEKRALVKEGLAATLALPISAGDDELLGCLCVSDRRPRAWTPRDLGVLEHVVTLVADELELLRRRGQPLGAAATGASLERLRYVVENVSEIVSILTPGGTILYESPAIARVLGRPVEERLGKSVFESVHPDDAAALAEVHTRALRQAGQELEVEFRAHHKDGTWRTFEGRLVDLRDEPAIGGLVLSRRDVTDRRRAEAEQARLAAVLEATPDFVCTADPIGRVLYLNRAARQMLGLGDDVTHRNLVDFHPWSAAQLLLSEALPAALRDGVWAGESMLLAHDGREVPVLQVVLAHRSQDGALEFLSTIIRDITDRKRDEQALRRSEATNRAILNVIPDLMFQIRRDGTVLSYKAKDGELFLASDESAGKSLAGLWPVELPQHILEPLRRTLDTGKVQVVEYQHAIGGDSRDYEARIVVSGEDEALVIVRDITERKHLEAQLRQSQKMEAVGRLAGGIAHDFNNLLTAIQGHTALLLDEARLESSERADLDEIRKAAERAASLTRQLLAFSRRQVLQPKVLDVNAVVRDLEKMLRRLIGEDIELVTELAPELGPVKADPGQLEQVILNLVVNARDAMPSGGRLLLESRNVELTEEYTRTHRWIEPGSYILLAVTDTGCGMNDEVLSRIFEPFFTTKDPGRGTGLGLSTVYGIVKQSGGSISVYSQVGRGTTFKIYLPRATETAAAPDGRRGKSEAPRGTETVLVAEDEEAVRALARRILQKNGYTVIEARNGAEALRLAETHPRRIDLLVTDVVMPEMGGPELAQRLAQQWPQARVLFTSGYTEHAIVRNGVLAPGVAFLEKPFSPDVFARKVREVLDSVGAGT